MNRLILLRKTYQFSLEEHGYILRIAKSAVFNLEKGGIPTLQTFITATSAYCVSFEWMLGLSSKPYTEASVSFGEDLLKERIRIVDRGKCIQKHLVSLNFDYWSNDYKKNMSLDVRANIAVLMRREWLNDVEIYRRNHKEEWKNKQSMEINFLTGNTKKHYRNTMFLHEMIRGNITEPVFDITNPNQHVFLN